MHSLSYLALSVLAFTFTTLSCPLLSGEPDPGSESPVSSLDKRYFLDRVFQEQEKGYDRWLNGQVFFCFDSSATPNNRAFLTAALPRVWNSLWKAGNPGIAHLTVLPGNDPNANPPRALCDDADNHRRSIVTVSINSNKKVATGPGGRSLALDLSYMGSSSFPYSFDAGLAHELGHVFGMEHEHQRRDFWDEDHRGSLPNGQQTTTFTCSNLADYNAQVKRVGKPMVDNTLCKDISEAIAAQFSAADWLPIQESTGLGDQPQSFFTSDDIDFSSLMMYPGRTGGRKSNVPGRGRKIVMSQPNDPSTPLDDGNVPTRASAQDIAGLTAMYPCQQGTQRRWLKKRNQEPVCGITPTAVPSAVASASFTTFAGYNQSISEIAVGTGISPPFTLSTFILTSAVASATASVAPSAAGVSSFAASATA